MSASPDFMTALMQALNGGQGGAGGVLNSPLFQTGLGIMNAAGPSRMPVSFGQALGQGFGQGQEMQNQSLQQAMQRLMLGRTQFQLNAMQNPQDLFAQSQGQPQSAAPITGDAGADTGNIAAASGLSVNPITGQSTANNNPQTKTVVPDDSSTYTPLQAGARSLFNRGYSYFVAGLPGGTEAMNTAVSMDPSIQRDLAAAKAQGEMGPKLLESIFSQAGRPVAVQPGETVTTGFANLPPGLQALAGSLAGGTPQTAGGTQYPSIPPVGGSGGNMSGVPTQGASPTSLGGVPAVTGPSLYSADLQKNLASADIEHVKSLWDDAKTASEGQQQLAEMWQSRNQGMYTGAGAAISGDIVKWASAAGIPLSDETKNQLTNLQTFNKGAANLGVAVAKSLSSRPSQFEFKYLSGNAIANPQMQDTSIPLVMSQMGSVFQWKQMKAQYVDDMMRKGINPRQAEANFDNLGSATPYALSILRQNDPASANKLLNYLKVNNPTMYAKVGRETQWLQQQGLMPSTQDLMQGSY